MASPGAAPRATPEGSAAPERSPGSPFFYLRNDEDVLLTLKPGGGFGLRLFVGAVLFLTFLYAVALVAAQQPRVPSFLLLYATGLYLALLVAAGLFAWRRWVTTEYVITDSRIYARTGRLRTTVHFTTHDRITDIHYHRGFLDRIFGVSSVMFATAGGNVRIAGVPDALVVKETAEEARDVFIQRLLEHAVPATGARVEEGRIVLERAGHRAAPPYAADATAASISQGEFPPPALPPLPPMAEWAGPRPEYLKKGDVPVWFGKPNLIAAVPAALPTIGFAVFIGIIAGPGGLFALPFILGLAALMIGYRVLQLNYTEYTVTTGRVYARSGVLGTTVRQLTYDKITDITYEQDVFGRILGFGGLTVNTAGSNDAPIVMVGLTKPLEVKETIERARARILREDEE